MQACDKSALPRLLLTGQYQSAIRVCISASLPEVPPPKRRLLIPKAYHRHCGRAVWIDPVVLRTITISWNNIRIPVWPYHRHPDDKPLPWLRMCYATKRPQVTQRRSESERYG